MARKWWSSLPSPYYSKPLSFGGRNEILFTVLGNKLATLLFILKLAELSIL
jgi:hypothetical protein